MDALPECLAATVRERDSIPFKRRFIIVDRKTGESILRGSDVFSPGIRAGTFSPAMRIGESISILCHLDAAVNSQDEPILRGEKLPSVTIVYEEDTGIELDTDTVARTYAMVHLANGTLLQSHD